jgi:integrase
MSQKGTITTADYLDFDRTLNKCIKMLKTERNFKIPFLVIVGINSGLRISDLLTLKHKDFQGNSIEIKEKKTNKYRKITINDNLKSAYQLFLSRLDEEPVNDNFIFVSQKNTVFAVRSVNRELKEILSDNKGKLNVSSHSLRKTFGRRVFQNNKESEKSLIFLSDMFNHSSVSLTRRYLGIRNEEISNIYLSL